MNGLISVLAPFFEPKFQPFNPGFGNIKGLSTNGLEQDRRFLVGLDRSDWIAEAEHIRNSLTPDVIESAIGRFPQPIQDLDGERIRRNLNSRAADLSRAASKYYDAMSRVVDIVGSDKHELFEVTRKPDGDVLVRMYKTTKDGDRRDLLLDRTFHHNETKQIRLFGLGGRDRFFLTGESRASIEVIAVGGPGKDLIEDSSSVAGHRQFTVFVDSERGTEIEAGRETRVRITDDVLLNTYDPLDFKYDVKLPQLYFSRNKDDGVFIGGGAIITRHGFRRFPFASQHRFVANIAAKTQAFNVRYSGTWTNAIGPWSLVLDANILTPNNIRNYYGLGNATNNTVEDRSFYQARLSRVDLAPTLSRSINEILSVAVGPYLQFTDVREESDRFLAQQPGVSATTFDNQWFGGVAASVALDAVDNAANPKQGFRWMNKATLRVGLSEESDTFARYSTDLAIYVSPVLGPQVTLALRAGAEHNQGDFPFFEASSLGGTSNLRGYRSTRYAGRTAAYQNSELRFKLFDVSSHVARGAFGLLGFVDVGRVWTDGESSSTWHTGYGGGAWLNIFGDVVVTASYGVSEDDQAFNIKLGFHY
jgi:hypothetical protein